MTSSTEFVAPDPEELSKLIPGFTVGHLLATGPDSAVYSAIQTSLERQVALRIYSPTASSDPERVRGVEATTRAMARLKHRNLIGLFDSGTREGMMYVVMEFVAGKPLARSLGGPVHQAQVRSIITGVCEGLAHAHQNKIAHGKLTEHAILLNPDAEPKIGGFQGGDFEKNKVADIVAVGRLLYLMLTGVEESSRSVEPSVLVNSPPELDEIWLRCTRRERKDAFATVQEVVEALTTKQKKMTAHAASAAPMPGAVPKAPVTTTVSSSSQWALVRNLVLIVVLIIAIIKVWGMTQRKEREILQRQREARQLAAQEQERRYQEALKKRIAKKPKGPSNNPNKPSTQQPGQAVREIREAPLSEIREALAEGKRDTLPVGSVRRGDSAYLLVRELLSWPEACWFAERHGAHLAIPDDSADLASLQSIADGEPYWLGAGRSGRSGKDAWRLVNGDLWEPSKEPAGLGRYLAADKYGFLRSAGDQVRLPCILQWRMDGSNPGKLESLLAAVAQAQDGGDPVFPPGTDLLGDRAYLVVARDVDWEQAKRLAERAGGHLAVASDAAEILHLQDMARNLTAGKPHWMGARRAEKGWAWSTGEAWRDLRVSGASTKVGAALAVSSDGGWLAMGAGEPAAGFVIEWAASPREHSRDTANNPDKPVNDGGNAVVESIGILDAQAKRLVQTAWDKRNQQLKDNASRMQSHLDVIFRNMNRTLQRDWEESMNDLKESIQNNRVPEDATALNVDLNEDMAKVVANAAAKQKSVDEDFAASANQVRDAYQKRLRDTMTKALEKDDRQTVLDLKPKLDASENLETWLEQLGFASED